MVPDSKSVSTGRCIQVSELMFLCYSARYIVFCLSLLLRRWMAQQGTVGTWVVQTPTPDEMLSNAVELGIPIRLPTAPTSFSERVSHADIMSRRPPATRKN